MRWSLADRPVRQRDHRGCPGQDASDVRDSVGESAATLTPLACVSLRMVAQSPPSECEEHLPPALIRVTLFESDRGTPPSALFSGSSATRSPDPPLRNTMHNDEQGNESRAPTIHRACDHDTPRIPPRSPAMRVYRHALESIFAMQPATTPASQPACWAGAWSLPCRCGSRSNGVTSHTLSFQPRFNRIHTLEVRVEMR